MIHPNPLGIILNGVPRKGVQADGYGYNYRSYYGRSEPRNHVPASTAPGGEEFDEMISTTVVPTSTRTSAAPERPRRGA